MDRSRLARPNSAGVLAALLATSGTAHFVVPGTYAAIVPKALGAPYAWVYASGLAELACAAAVLNRSTRRKGALAGAVLFVAVFPANVQMAVTSARHGGWTEVLAFARLPLQVPLVWWAWRVSRTGQTR